MSKKQAKEINDFAQETARYVSAGHETLYYAKQWGKHMVYACKGLM